MTSSELEGSIYDQVREAGFTPLEPESPSEVPVAPEGAPAPPAPPEAPERAEAAQEEAPVEFDPRHREDFIGLLYLGKISHTFYRWGHKFEIKTLTTEDLAKVALATKEYEGTRASNMMYQAGVVAAGIERVDNRPLVEPLGLTLDVFPAKLEYVSANYAPPVREKIWTEIFNLEARVRLSLDQMGNPSG